jgi:hypothetical protein
MWVGGGPNLARDWAQYGRATVPRPGAIGVMNGHVGVVKEIRGNLVILVSGNHTGKSGNRKVGIGSYSMHRFIAFREPEPLSEDARVGTSQATSHQSHMSASAITDNRR